MSPEIDDLDQTLMTDLTLMIQLDVTESAKHASTLSAFILDSPQSVPALISQDNLTDTSINHNCHNPLAPLTVSPAGFNKVKFLGRFKLKKI